ncbi:unnamed protein product [marine sediment metagenome]|uniref:Uncharacterized protein n=1 Tax=marine sediment metagenome TaxID=412755 RepID=X1D761_9ZZZZ
MKTFKTSDVGVAAYLIATGAKFAYEFAVECERVVFEIANVSDAQLAAYMDGGHNVNAGAFIKHQRQLIRISKDTMRAHKEAKNNG